MGLCLSAYVLKLKLCLLQDLNLAVCGSQIVGLVPLKAVMDCAEYYMKKENLFILEEDQKIRLVRKSIIVNRSRSDKRTVTHNIIFINR